MPDYPPAVRELLALAPPTALGPGAPDPALRGQIKTAFQGLAPTCAAGLWLLFDFLDESHGISQSAEGTPDYDFWHAIMHRREPDAWNAKYWWRRVGAHPVLGQLRERAPELGYAYTTPDAFVDFCEQVRGTGTAGEDLAKRVQRLEWDLLFAWCFGSSAK